jgi:hypothetical protein
VLAYQRSRTETVIGSPSLRPRAPRRWTSPSSSCGVPKLCHAADQPDLQAGIGFLHPTGPAPDGEACQVEADADLSLGAADEPRLVSRPLARPRPLSAAAAVRSLGDGRTEYRRRSHRSHARDGPVGAPGARPQPTIPAFAKPSPRRASVWTNQLCLLSVGFRAFTHTVSAQRIDHDRNGSLNRVSLPHTPPTPWPPDGP